MSDCLLSFYFLIVLEAASLLPAPAVFRLVSRTGYFFRRWETYAAWFEPGVLLKAMKSMKESHIAFPCGVKAAVRDYLCFESRMVAENIWIRKNDPKLLNCFFPPHISRLREYLNSGPYVIVTAHTSALYSLVALLDRLGFTSPFLCNNPLRQRPETATPLQKNVMRTMAAWISRQPLFFVEEGEGFRKSLAAIKSGRSVVVAQDVPGYSERGVRVRLFDKTIRSPAGPAKLAQQAGVSMLPAVGWASDCREPYRIFLKELVPTGNPVVDMQAVCKGIEQAVTKGPSCWGGWLYLDKMVGDGPLEKVSEG